MCDQGTMLVYANLVDHLISQTDLQTKEVQTERGKKISWTVKLFIDANYSGSCIDAVKEWT